jgi:hypothetical protein
MCRSRFTRTCQFASADGAPFTLARCGRRGWQAESRRFPAGSAFRHSLFPAEAGAAYPALAALQPRIRKGGKRSGNQIVML